MSEDRHKHLLKRYLAAESTLKEEEELFNAENQPEGIEEWSVYARVKRKKVPDHLEASIWKSIQNRKKRKHRFLTGLSAVAASIAIFVAVFINSKDNNNISHDEKAALLKEALSMFPEENNKASERKIIYEDDMIVIYTTSK